MNGYAKRAADRKQDKRESARSMQTLVNERMATSRYKTKRVRNERPATAERRERTALYGKWNPLNGVSDCCMMLRAASGECTGCGELAWHVEALMDMEPVCESRIVSLAQAEHDALMAAEVERLNAEDVA